MLAPAKLSNANLAQGASSRQARRIRATILLSLSVRILSSSRPIRSHYSIFNGEEVLLFFEKLDSFETDKMKITFKEKVEKEIKMFFFF